MKRHKDFYEYKTIPFTYFKKVANRYDFKREWVSVRCQEDIMKLKPEMVEIRRLIKNVWHKCNMDIIIFNCRIYYSLLLTQEGLIWAWIHDKQYT